MLRLRYSELVVCLAAAGERAMGRSANHVLRAAALAMRLAAAAGLAGSELRNVYYQAQLRFIGCNADTDAIGAIGGDVLALRQAMAPIDARDLRSVVAALVRTVRDARADASAPARYAAVLRALARAAEFDAEIFPGHCEVAQRLGRRLGFDERFVTGLGQLYARWDGKGVPATAGEAILPAVRVVVLAQEMELHHRQGGWEAACSMMRERAGRQLDPALCALAQAAGESLFAGLPEDWEALLALEPAPHEWLEGRSLEAAMRVLSDYASIQSRWLLEHATHVADLARAAANALDLPDDERERLHLAALVHDIGRVAVSTNVWDDPRPLGPSERDSVRRHALHTTQILARAPSLVPLARLAGSAHERVDGSGYARGESGDSLPRAARLLAAADVVAALGEARPYRDAFAPDDIEGIVGNEVTAGRIDRTAAQAVLKARGLLLREPPPARAWPAGLSEREIQVLALLARGRTNKEIARSLGISPKTVGHQVQSAYRKAGVHTRAAATLFAMEHRLLDRAGPG